MGYTAQAICLWPTRFIACIIYNLFPLQGDGVQEAGFPGSDFTLLPPMDLLHYIIADSSLSIIWSSKLQK